MTDDDRMDVLLRQMATEDYNRPPEIVPREPMWEAVRKELGNGRVPGEAGRMGTGTRDQGSGNRDALGISRVGRVPRWVYFAAAAAVLLAAGIQIGRRMGAGRVAPQMVVVPNAPAAPDTSARRARAPDVPPVAPPSRQVAVAEPTAPAGRSDDGGKPKPRPGSSGPELAPGTSLPDAAAARAYTVATAQYLTEVEAMLTVFKGDPAPGRMDAQLASWGKDLLTNTRLLLDSPAARDPVRRKLLQDLELVLVQIVQLSPGAPARDRDLIKGALTDDQVLTRLRTALPVLKGT